MDELISSSSSSAWPLRWATNRVSDVKGTLDDGLLILLFGIRHREVGNIDDSIHRSNGVNEGRNFMKGAAHVYLEGNLGHIVFELFSTWLNVSMLSPD